MHRAWNAREFGDLPHLFERDLGFIGVTARARARL